MLITYFKILIKKDKDIDFNDVKLQNTKFVKVNYQPAANKDLTPIIYVDSAIHE